MSKEADDLLKEIQYKTGKTLEEIAVEIGYSRPYLNKVKLMGGGEKIIGILKQKYAEILQNVPRANLPEVDKSISPDVSALIKTNQNLSESVKSLSFSHAELILLLKAEKDIPNSVLQAMEERQKLILSYMRAWVGASEQNHSSLSEQDLIKRFEERNKDIADQARRNRENDKRLQDRKGKKEPHG